MTNRKEVFTLPFWIPPQTWEGFEEMRKKVKAPLTDYARRLIVKQLGNLHKEGYPPVKVLNQSIVNSWRDVYPLKGSRGNGPQMQSYVCKVCGFKRSGLTKDGICLRCLDGG